MVIVYENIGVIVKGYIGDLLRIALTPNKWCDLDPRTWSAKCNILRLSPEKPSYNIFAHMLYYSYEIY